MGVLFSAGYPNHCAPVLLAAFSLVGHRSGLHPTRLQYVASSEWMNERWSVKLVEAEGTTSDASGTIGQAGERGDRKGRKHGKERLPGWRPVLLGWPKGLK